MKLPTWLTFGGVDFRTTFLRWHVERELCLGAYTARQHFENSLRDILFLDELRDRLEAEGHSYHVLSQLLRPESFFYRDLPDINAVYLPIRVHEVGPDGTRRGKPYVDLSHLIRCLSQNQDRDPSGVLLCTRSGAGKTVAARKAFYDCFFSVAGEQPVLDGHLPCWVGAPGSLPANDVRLIEWLVRQSAFHEQDRLIKTSPDVVARWLEHTPPLLLFFDLNAIGSDPDRQRLADALGRFQDPTAGQRWGRRHRCVVAYRSTQGSDDPVLQSLWPGKHFRRYDLEPLRPEDAELYLRRARSFENGVYRNVEKAQRKPQPQMKDRWSEEDIESTCRRLRAFVKRHVTQYEGAQESVVSTPLLMHFAALLDTNEYASVVALAHLYDHIVRRHIVRDQTKYADRHPQSLKGGVGRERVIVAMTRIALAILGQGATSTRLDRAMLNTVLEAPTSARVLAWWHADPRTSWSSYRYGSERFDKNEIAPLLEFSLLRDYGGSVGFLHDSLIYYFAGALALGAELGPCLPIRERIPDDNWWSVVLTTLTTDPQRWLAPVEFLAGALANPPTQAQPHVDTSCLRQLAAELLLADTNSRFRPIDQFELVARLLRGRPIPIPSDDEPSLTNET